MIFKFFNCKPSPHQCIKQTAVLAARMPGKPLCICVRMLFLYVLIKFRMLFPQFLLSLQLAFVKTLKLNFICFNFFCLKQNQMIVVRIKFHIYCKQWFHFRKEKDLITFACKGIITYRCIKFFLINTGNLKTNLYAFFLTQLFFLADFNFLQACLNTVEYNHLKRFGCGLFWYVLHKRWFGLLN